MPNLQSPPFAISLPCLFLITSQASLEIKRENCYAQICEASFHVIAGKIPTGPLWGHWHLVCKLTPSVWALEVTLKAPRFSSIPRWCIQNSLHTLESVFNSLNIFRKTRYFSPKTTIKKRGFRVRTSLCKLKGALQLPQVIQSASVLRQKHLCKSRALE